MLENLVRLVSKPGSWLYPIGIVVLLISHAPTTDAQMLPGVVKAAPEDSVEKIPPAPSPNDLRELILLLSDESVVTWLRGQTIPVANQDGMLGTELSVQEWLRKILAGFEQQLRRRVRAWAQVSSGVANLQRHWMSQMSEGETLRSFIYVGLRGSVWVDIGIFG